MFDNKELLARLEKQDEQITTLLTRLAESIDLNRELLARLEKQDEQITTLLTRLAESIDLNRELLKKVDSEHTKLFALADFVSKNSASTAAFARTR